MQSFRSPLQMVWHQVQEYKHLITRPLLLVVIFIYAIPSSLIWLYLAQEGLNVGADLRELSFAISKGEGLKSGQNLLILASSYFQNSFIMFFTFLLFCLWFYLSCISMIIYVMQNRERPNFLLHSVSSLKRLPRAFMSFIFVILALTLWFYINQTLLAALAGFTLPIGTMFFIAVMLMAPVMQMYDNSKLSDSIVKSLKMTYAKQTHYPVRAIFFHLVNLIIFSYIFSTLVFFGAELFVELDFSSYGSGTAPNVSGIPLQAIISFSFQLLAGLCVMPFLAIMTTTLYVSLKELQQVGQDTEVNLA
ncbi:MAG: hypothetical protein KBD78_13330 [Oligoflexales bacterium]|nr:hypothetical protein [Oligoflexales bacterium]